MESICLCPDLLHGHYSGCEYSQSTDFIPPITGISNNIGEGSIEELTEARDAIKEKLSHFLETGTPPLHTLVSEGCHCDCCDQEPKLQFPDPKTTSYIFIKAPLVARLYLDANNVEYSYTTADYVMVPGGEAHHGFEMYSDQTTLPFTPCYSFTDSFIKWFQIKAIRHGWDATFVTDYQQLLKSEEDEKAESNRFPSEPVIPEFFHAGVFLKSREL